LRFEAPERDSGHGDGNSPSANPQTSKRTLEIMNLGALQKPLIGAAIAFAVYKYAPNAVVKSAAVGVLGLIVAKQLPFIKEAV
jgi:hypothetical protein